MKVLVGVHQFSPLTEYKNAQWTGFEIELWEEVAKRLTIEYEYVEVKNFDRLLKRVEKGELDVGIAGITRTVERNQKMNMSFLSLDTGMTVGVAGDRSFGLSELVQKIFSKSTLGVLGILIAFSLFIAHGYWLFERGYSVALNYADGIFNAFWWAFVTFSTVGYGDISPETTLGKLFALFSISLGLALFGLFIAQLSSSLTLGKLHNRITAINDISGKRIAVKKDTTAIEVVEDYGGIPNQFSSVEEAVVSVLEKKSDAVVADAPTLQHMKHIPELLLVGGLFARQSYSFVTPPKSRLMKKINATMIEIRQDETYDRLYAKYFK